MPARLTPTRFRELSLVPRGSNPKADVTVVKEDTGDSVPSALEKFTGSMRKAFELIAGEHAPAVMAALNEADEALKTEVATPGDDVLDDGAGDTETAKQAALVADVLAKMTGMKGCADCKPGQPCKDHKAAYDKAAETIAKEAASVSEIMARESMWSMTSALRESITSILADTEVADKTKAIKQTIAQFTQSVLASTGTPLAKGDAGHESNQGDNAMSVNTEKSAATPAPETVTKAEFDAQSAQLATVTKSLETVTKALESVTGTIAEIRKEQQRQAGVAVAKEALGDLPGDAEKIASALEKLSAEEREELTKTLAGAREMVKTAALFGTRGIDAKPQPGSADEAITAKAAEVRKAEPSLSPEQAYTKALEANPDLAKRLRQEQGYGGR